jgi:hypothetical protein
MVKPPESAVVQVRVLILCAGPSRPALSVCLRRVDHLPVERHAGTARRPPAHSNLWVTTQAGREVARSETWSRMG